MFWILDSQFGAATTELLLATQSKTYFELYEGFKTIQQIFFIQVSRPTSRALSIPSHLAVLFKSKLNPVCWATKNFKNGRIWEVVQPV